MKRLDPTASTSSSQPTTGSGLISMSNCATHDVGTSDLSTLNDVTPSTIVTYNNTGSSDSNKQKGKRGAPKFTYIENEVATIDYEGVKIWLSIVRDQKQKDELELKANAILMENDGKELDEILQKLREGGAINLTEKVGNNRTKRLQKTLRDMAEKHSLSADEKHLSELCNKLVVTSGTIATSVRPMNPTPPKPATPHLSVVPLPAVAVTPTTTKAKKTKKRKQEHGGSEQSSQEEGAAQVSSTESEHRRGSGARGSACEDIKFYAPHFSLGNRVLVRARQPDLSDREVSSAVAANWMALSADERADWEAVEMDRNPPSIHNCGPSSHPSSKSSSNLPNNHPSSISSGSSPQLPTTDVFEDGCAEGTGDLRVAGEEESEFAKMEQQKTQTEKDKEKKIPQKRKAQLSSDGEARKEKRAETMFNNRKSAALPAATVEYLRAWMMSQEHVAHPYPTEQEKAQLMADTGIELKQLTNWFANNRKRYWKPRVEAAFPMPPPSHYVEYAVNDDRETYRLATANDSEYLSDRQCYVRSHLLEIFVANKNVDTVRKRSEWGRIAKQIGRERSKVIASIKSKDDEKRTQEEKAMLNNWNLGHAVRKIMAKIEQKKEDERTCEENGMLALYYMYDSKRSSILGIEEVEGEEVSSAKDDFALNCAELLAGDDFEIGCEEQLLDSENDFEVGREEPLLGFEDFGLGFELLLLDYGDDSELGLRDDDEDKTELRKKKKRKKKVEFEVKSDEELMEMVTSLSQSNHLPGGNESDDERDESDQDEGDNSSSLNLVQRLALEFEPKSDEELMEILIEANRPGNWNRLKHSELATFLAKRAFIAAAKDGDIQQMSETSEGVTKAQVLEWMNGSKIFNGYQQIMCAKWAKFDAKMSTALKEAGYKRISGGGRSGGSYRYALPEDIVPRPAVSEEGGWEWVDAVRICHRDSESRLPKKKKQKTQDLNLARSVAEKAVIGSKYDATKLPEFADALVRECEMSEEEEQKLAERYRGTVKGASKPVKIMSLDAKKHWEVFFESKLEAAKRLGVSPPLIGTNTDQKTGIFTLCGTKICRIIDVEWPKEVATSEREEDELDRLSKMIVAAKAAKTAMNPVEIMSLDGDEEESLGVFKSTAAAADKLGVWDQRLDSHTDNITGAVTFYGNTPVCRIKKVDLLVFMAGERGVVDAAEYKLVSIRKTIRSQVLRMLCTGILRDHMLMTLEVLKKNVGQKAVPLAEIEAVRKNTLERMKKKNKKGEYGREEMSQALSQAEQDAQRIFMLPPSQQIHALHS
ncbi:hypothetical protein ACHAWC_004893 [Mediolabrus comicus]